MKGIRYTAEFKVEALKQITERGHGVVEVSKRLGVSDKSKLLESTLLLPNLAWRKQRFTNIFQAKTIWSLLISEINVISFTSGLIRNLSLKKKTPLIF